MNKKIEQTIDNEIAQVANYLLGQNNVLGAYYYLIEQEKKKPSSELSAYIVFLLVLLNKNKTLIQRLDGLHGIVTPFPVVEKIFSALSKKRRFDLLIKIASHLKGDVLTTNSQILYAQALVLLGENEQAAIKLKTLFSRLKKNAFKFGIGKLALRAKLYELSIEVSQFGMIINAKDEQERKIDVALAYQGKNDIDKAIHIIHSLPAPYDDKINDLLARLYCKQSQFLKAEEALKSLSDGYKEQKAYLELMRHYLTSKGNSKALLDLASESYDKNQKSDWAKKLYGKILGDLGLKSEKGAFLARLLDRQERLSADLLSSCAMTPLYDRAFSEEEIFDIQKRVASRYEDKRLKIYSTKNKKIRIGYVSSDLNSHSVFHFIFPVIKSHSRNHFEVIAYYAGDKFDSCTKAVKQHTDKWRVITYLSTDDAISAIQNDNIDILIDLNGHTKGNRLDIFANRVAKIQATWIGYPATTGIQNIDYRFTDGFVDDIKSTNPLYSEKLLEINPNFFMVYQPPEISPSVSELPAKKNGHITFGSLNNFAKIDDELIKVWAKILLTIPNSKLIIKNRAMQFSDTRNKVKEIFKREGIEDGQLSIRPWDSFQEQHFEVYSDIDVALDSYPYSGTTTTCECLWMGVPVITLYGRAHRSRVSAGIQRVVGLQGYIAKDKAEYIKIAQSCAENFDQLNSIRLLLREKMEQSPLMQYKSFIAHYEGALKGLLKQA